MASWEKQFLYPRPTEPQLELERVPQPGVACEECGREEVARYPVASHQGARIMTRCQHCLHIVSVERPRPEDMWPPFRAVAYDWEPSLAERSSRDEFDRG
jgi:hypothetical protein